MPHHLVPNGQIRANVPHETVKTLFPNHFRDVPLESGRLSSIKTIELHNAHNLTFSCNSNMAYAPLSVSGHSFSYDARGDMT